MGLRGEDYTALESGLDRIIALAETILERLQSGKKLSDILPQARFLAEMNEDATQMAWLDCEIHGMGRVPIVPAPQLTYEQQKGAQIFNEMHRGDKESISVIEHLAISEHPEYKKRIYYAMLSEEDRYSIYRALEIERVLGAVRAAVYEYVSKVWLDGVREKENLSLLGPDYKIVINNLDALETGVGQELRAALDSLSSDNPANWSASALVCRNVIIKLGDSLWKVPRTEYFSELDNKELDLVGDKEKNRLYAYIDYHHKHIEEQEHKDTLKQLHGMVWRIWDIGSKAKRSIRHEEAKTIVIDTFEFVNNLDAITELKPLEEI